MNFMKNIFLTLIFLCVSISTFCSQSDENVELSLHKQLLNAAFYDRDLFDQLCEKHTATNIRDNDINLYAYFMGWVEIKSDNEVAFTGSKNQALWHAYCGEMNEDGKAQIAAYLRTCIESHRKKDDDEDEWGKFLKGYPQVMSLVKLAKNGDILSESLLSIAVNSNNRDAVNLLIEDNEDRIYRLNSSEISLSDELLALLPTENAYIKAFLSGTSILQKALLQPKYISVDKLFGFVIQCGILAINNIDKDKRTFLISNYNRMRES